MARNGMASAVSPGSDKTNGPTRLVGTEVLRPANARSKVPLAEWVRTPTHEEAKDGRAGSTRGDGDDKCSPRPSGWLRVCESSGPCRGVGGDRWSCRWNAQLRASYLLVNAQCQRSLRRARLLRPVIGRLVLQRRCAPPVRTGSFSAVLSSITQSLRPMAEATQRGGSCSWQAVL